MNASAASVAEALAAVIRQAMPAARDLLISVVKVEGIDRRHDMRGIAQAFRPSERIETRRATHRAPAPVSKWFRSLVIVQETNGEIDLAWFHRRIESCG